MVCNSGAGVTPPLMRGEITTSGTRPALLPAGGGVASGRSSPASLLALTGKASGACCCNQRMAANSANAGISKDSHKPVEDFLAALVGRERRSLCRGSISGAGGGQIQAPSVRVPALVWGLWYKVNAETNPTIRRRSNAPVEQSPLIAIGLPIALFIIMIGMGLTLTPADFKREARAPRGLVVGSLLQLAVLPVIGLLLMGMPGLSATLAVGVVIVAACPGGTTSNLISFLARGNVALSIILTVIASLATIATLPFWVNLALQQAGLDHGDTPLHLPFLKTVVMLAVLILVPVAIGMVVRNRNATLAARADRAVSLFGALVLLLLIIGIAWTNRDRLGTLLSLAGPACAALNIAGILLGVVGGRVMGLSARDSLTVAVELGVKNSTIGLLVAMTLLHNTEMAVPSAVYGIMMYGFGFALVAWGKRQHRDALPA